MLERQGQLAEAILHYQQAMRLRPDLADPSRNLGRALARQRQLTEAGASAPQAQRPGP